MIRKLKEDQDYIIQRRHCKRRSIWLIIIGLWVFVLAMMVFASVYTVAHDDDPVLDDGLYMATVGDYTLFVKLSDGDCYDLQIINRSSDAADEYEVWEIGGDDCGVLFDVSPGSWTVVKEKKLRSYSYNGNQV